MKIVAPCHIASGYRSSGELVIICCFKILLIKSRMTGKLKMMKSGGISFENLPRLVVAM